MTPSLSTPSPATRDVSVDPAVALASAAKIRNRSAAHLTASDVEELGRRFDAIREDVIATRGASDAAYIRKVVKAQRVLEAGGRAALLVSLFPPAWLAGTTALSVSKILENMEIGHNVMHGQWDWMRDPEIHSTTWEWDNATPSADWKHSHNYIHHTYTNVLGKDRDIGYGFMRMGPDQEWKPWHLTQPAINVALMLLFEYGIAIYDAEPEKVLTREKPVKEVARHLRGVLGKVRQQVVKDYVATPLAAGLSFLPALAGTVTANVARNVWSHTIIFCGHFPEGAEVFVEEQLEGETRGEWYLRQLLGSANLEGGPALHLMSGNLSFQIEHHLFPDLPSNRYVEIAPRVRAVCEEFGLPYTSGPLPQQYASMWKRLLRHSLPGGTPTVTVTATQDEAAAAA
jgi:NADPH-dependent stearoyl-CoA 9-desaturase